jgi:hypothetical protein
MPADTHALVPPTAGVKHGQNSREGRKEDIIRTKTSKQSNRQDGSHADTACSAETMQIATAADWQQITTMQKVFLCASFASAQPAARAPSPLADLWQQQHRSSSSDTSSSSTLAGARSVD